MKFFQAPAKFDLEYKKNKLSIFLKTHSESSFCPKLYLLFATALRENQLTIYNLNNGFQVWLRNAPGFTQITNLFNLVTFLCLGSSRRSLGLVEKRRANMSDSLRTKWWDWLPFVITTLFNSFLEARLSLKWPTIIWDEPPENYANFRTDLHFWVYSAWWTIWNAKYSFFGTNSHQGKNEQLKKSS